MKTSWWTTYKMLSRSIRNFEMKDISQIKTVYPGAFQYRQEKTSGHHRYVEYKLTVEAVTDEELSPGAGRSAVLMKRKEQFIRRLTKMVIQHHKVTAHLSSSIIEPRKLTLPRYRSSWHPWTLQSRYPRRSCFDGTLPSPWTLSLMSTKQIFLSPLKQVTHPLTELPSSCDNSVCLSCRGVQHCQ